MQEGELQEAIKNDPVLALRQILLDDNQASEEMLSQIEKQNSDALEEAIEFAYSSDYPDIDEITVDVFEEKVA